MKIKILLEIQCFVLDKYLYEWHDKILLLLLLCVHRNSGTLRDLLCWLCFSVIFQRNIALQGERNTEHEKIRKVHY